MHFSKAVVTAVVALLPGVLGSPVLETRQNGVTCQTSSGSPNTGDVTAVINQLKGQGGDCANTNDEASDCSTLVEHDTAAISICGGEGKISCATVAGYANQIQQTCVGAGGRVGGTYTIDQSTRVEVINTKSV